MWIPILAIIIALALPAMAAADDARHLHTGRTERGCIYHVYDYFPPEEPFTWSGPCESGQPINGFGRLEERYWDMDDEHNVFRREGQMVNGYLDGTIRTTHLYIEPDGRLEQHTEFVSNYAMGCPTSYDVECVGGAGARTRAAASQAPSSASGATQPSVQSAISKASPEAARVEERSTGRTLHLKPDGTPCLTVVRGSRPSGGTNYIEHSLRVTNDCSFAIRFDVDELPQRLGTFRTRTLSVAASSTVERTCLAHNQERKDPLRPTGCAGLSNIRELPNR